MSGAKSKDDEQVVEAVLPTATRRRRPPPPWENAALLRRAEERRDLLLEARTEEAGATAPTLQELDAAEEELAPLAPPPPPGVDRGRGLSLAQGDPAEDRPVSQAESLAFWSRGPGSWGGAEPDGSDEPLGAHLADLPGDGALPPLSGPHDDEIDALPDEALQTSPDGPEGLTAGETGEYLWGAQPSLAPEETLSVDQLEAVMAGYSLTSIPALPASAATISVDEAIAEAERLFSIDKAAEGMALLEAVAYREGEDPRIETWYALGERRLIRRYCPDATPATVPRMLRPHREVLRRARGSQRALAASIDGKRSFAELRALLPGIKVVGFWKDFARLREHGWVDWGDP